MKQGKILGTVFHGRNGTIKYKNIPFHRIYNQRVPMTDLFKSRHITPMTVSCQFFEVLVSIACRELDGLRDLQPYEMILGFMNG